MNIRTEVKLIKDALIATRRDIHQHPELGFQETRTAALVASRLKTAGLDVQEQVGRTGVVGRLIGAKPGPTVALRADMDALPMQETGDLPYKSVHEDVMHACGHDGHTAMLISTAEILAARRDQIRGEVRFIFQPAEEGEGGARYMIDDGALDGVDEIYGLHLWNYQSFGTVGVASGPVLASADIFRIVIKGQGGHGAAPQGTVDTIVVASQLINALQTIVSRNTNPLDSTVVTVGRIEGGSNFNIIAAETVLSGTTRAYTPENRRMVKERMQQIIAGVAAANGAEIDLEYDDGYPPTINNETTVEHARQAALKIAGEGVGAPFMTMGGEDFSYYAQQVPGCFIFVGSEPRDAVTGSVPHHCPYFNIEEDALLVGVSVFVQLIEDRLIKT